MFLRLSTKATGDDVYVNVGQVTRVFTIERDTYVEVSSGKVVVVRETLDEVLARLAEWK